ncbi:MAG: hypothetical protein RLZZ174_1770, partial [Pseudomonadota bacterium]
MRRAWHFLGGWHRLDGERIHRLLIIDAWDG